jgi:hypothetical protein
MSRFAKYAGIALLIAAIAALAISSLAFAQGTTAIAPIAKAANFVGFGGRGTCGQAGLDAAAQALKMTSTDLSAQLWGGRTLADLADKAGVKLTDVQSAVQAACTQAMKNAIQQAVTAGRITQAQADWLNEGIDKGYIGKGGFGFGFGFGMMGAGRGFHGFGRFGAPNGTAPNAAPNRGTTPAPSGYRF